MMHQYIRPKRLRRLSMMPMPAHLPETIPDILDDDMAVSTHHDPSTLSSEPIRPMNQESEAVLSTSNNEQEESIELISNDKPEASICNPESGSYESDAEDSDDDVEAEQILSVPNCSPNIGSFIDAAPTTIFPCEVSTI
jgi:hypothetical protein